MSAEDPKLEALLDELDRLNAAREALPPAAELAARHGLSQAAVEDVLAGLEALGDAIEDAPEEAPHALPRISEDFEIAEELGRGGMGVVYRARQRSLDRDVAVKVVRPGQLVFGEALERFDRETRALAKLRHPNIAAIHEVGRADGELYFTMDLIEGGTLADLVRAQRRPLPFAFVVDLVAKVAGAVGFVHRHGLVHRDLKPANVLLDEDQEPYVVDFGLAVDVAGGHTLTATGRLLGTPAYMAPEQAAGERALVTERTDIYALGVMLYELVCGRAPFEGRSLVDTIHAVVHADPPRPRSLRKDVPRALETIITKAMEKDPGQRYSTAEALCADLERFVRGEPLAAEAPGLLSPLRRLWRRHRSVLSGVAAGAAATLAVFLGAGQAADETSLEDQLTLVRKLQSSGQWRAAAEIAAAAEESLPRGGTLSMTGATLAFEALVRDLAALDEEHGQASIPAQQLDGFEEKIDLLGGRGGLVHHLRALRHGLAERRAGMRQLWKVDVLDQPTGARRDGSRAYGSSGLGVFSRIEDPRFGFLDVAATDEHPLEGYLLLRNGMPDTFGRGLDITSRRQLMRRMTAVTARRPSGDFRGHFDLGLSDMAGALMRFESEIRGSDLAALRGLVLDDEAPFAMRINALNTALFIHDMPELRIELRYPGDGIVTGGEDLMSAESFFASPAPETTMNALAGEGRISAATLREDRAEALLEIWDALGRRRYSSFGRELDRWFQRKWGAALPKAVDEVTPWFTALTSRGPFASIEGAIAEAGVAVPSTPEEAVTALTAAPTIVHAQLHEWLLLKTETEEMQRPWWPSSLGVGNSERAVPGKLVAEAWRMALTGERSAGFSTADLAVIHWPAGNGVPRIVALGPLELDDFRGSTELRAEIPGAARPPRSRATWHGPGPYDRAPGGRLGGRSGGLAPAELLVRANAIVRSATERRQFSSQPKEIFAVRASVELGATGRELQPVDRDSDEELRPGDVRVIADLLSKDASGQGERFAVLAAMRGSSEQPGPRTVEDWTNALATSLTEKVGPATGSSDVPFGPQNLECLARLAHDLGAASPCRARCRALVEALIAAWGGPGGIGSLKDAAAADALRLVLGGPLKGTLRARVDARGDRPSMPFLAERLALDPRDDVRQAARESLRSGYRDATRAELREIAAMMPLRSPLATRLAHDDRVKDWRLLRTAFGWTTVFLLLVAALAPLSQRAVAITGSTWAVGVALLSLFEPYGLESVATDLFLLPAFGFMLIAGTGQPPRRAVGGLFIAGAVALIVLALPRNERSALDAAAMAMGALAFALHAWSARRAEVRGAHVVGARLALLAIAPTLGLAWVSWSAWQGSDQMLVHPHRTISPGLLIGALIALAALLLRELLLGRRRPTVRRGTRRRAATAL